MPSATFDKLNQLKAQLQQCNNETAALLLKRTISKLESQLQTEQLTTKSGQGTPTDSPKTSQKKSKRQPPSKDKVKAEPQTTPQQDTAKTPQAKSKRKDHHPQKRRLLLGNGSHRAWCRIPGIIRVQEPETEGEQLQYFLEVEEHQLPVRVKKRFTKLIGASLDKPLMVKCYPHIMNGQIVSVQFCGTVEPTPENPEDWVLIGVWNSGNKRVLVQRDQKFDPSRRILQHSPLVTDKCLEKLEGGKLYRFECQRQGVMVTVVDVETVEGEKKNSNQAVS